MRLLAMPKRRLGASKVGGVTLGLLGALVLSAAGVLISTGLVLFGSRVIPETWPAIIVLAVAVGVVMGLAIRSSWKLDQKRARQKREERPG